ncbi:MAG: hypothetical protein ACOVOY_00855 [Sediminibacterium sp.]|jgi:hypothetical protein
MKKVLLLFIFFASFISLNAATVISFNSNKISYNSKESTDHLFFRSSMRVSVTDHCGQRLSFTVSCNGCSYADLADAANDFIMSHTNREGCYFL